MDEQSKPPRRPRVAGDIERTAIGRTRRVEGIPQFVDPTSEVSASVLMAAQLDVLGDRLDQISTSLTAWVNETVRHNEQIKALSTSVGSVVAYTESAGRSQVKTEAKLERAAELLEGIAETLKDLVVRVGRLEGSVERLTHNDASLEVRLEATAKMQNAMDDRLTAIERRLADAALTTAVATQERKKWFTWTRAALFGAGSVAMFVVKELGLLG